MESLKNNTEPVQNKPKPQPERKRLLLVALLGGFVLLVGATLLLWQVLASQASPPAQTGVVLTPTAEPTKSGPGDPQAYYDAVKQDVSQQLHMSEAQIKTKLQAGVQLIALAEQQGISAAQLRTILLEAEQKGHDVPGTGRISHEVAIRRRDARSPQSGSPDPGNEHQIRFSRSLRKCFLQPAISPG